VRLLVAARLGETVVLQVVPVVHGVLVAAEDRNSERADRIDLARRAGVIVQTGHVERFNRAIRGALQRLGISWKRAKHAITSPDPQYAQKNTGATA